MRRRGYRLDRLSRRTLLGAGALAGAAGAAGLAFGRPSGGRPIVDTHIHLFDPRRPQGAPYRGPKGTVFNTVGADPATYARLMRPLGVVGAVVVEASPWPEDNLWVLEAAARDPIIVGVIGNLKPEAPDFAETLERYAKNPLFRGIRYGNLWGYDIAERSRERPFLDGLKLLADADLVLDTANPSVPLLQALVRINDAIPHLRVVIDHLPKLAPAPDEQTAYDEVLAEIGRRPALSVKLSAVIHAVGGTVSRRLEDHKARLDTLCEVFGDDRVLFGSDWPNVEGDAPAAAELALVRSYFAARSPAQRDKYFSGNSRRIYKWRARTADQQRAS